MNDESLYGKPPELDAPPASVTSYAVWLEAADDNELDLYHAYVSVNPIGQLAWHGELIARNVRPLHGVLLVDALRAYGGGEDRK